MKEKEGLEDVYLGETEEAKQVSNRSDEADWLTCFTFRASGYPEVRKIHISFDKICPAANPKRDLLRGAYLYLGYMYLPLSIIIS